MSDIIQGASEGAREMKHISIYHSVDNLAGAIRKAEEIVKVIRGDKDTEGSAKEPAPLRRQPSLHEVLNETPNAINESTERLLKALFAIEELLF